MSASRCFIHIGAPKTGSTFLQKLLFDNRDVLARQDVLYPDVSLRGFGHHDFAFLLSGGYPGWATPQPKSLEDLTAELAAADRNHSGSLLLSSEVFYLFPQPQELYELLDSARALKGRDVTVVAYVRRQDDAHESWYNQTVKAQGETHSLKESVERWHDLWDYATQLDRWANVFGVSSIVVRPYETRQFKNASLVDDFFGCIGAATDQLTVPAAYVNSRINRDLLEFQRLINRLPLDARQKRRFHRQLISLTTKTAGTGIFDDAPLLDAAARRKILDSYRGGNTQVAAKYLHREQLFLEEPVDAAARSPARGLTAKKFAYLVGWLLTHPHDA